jgi:Tfp pilus assembly protein PilF
MKSPQIGLAILVASGLAGCAPLATCHRGDAAFRSAVAAQLGGDEERAEALYRYVLGLGIERSDVYNNLAVIAVHHHKMAEGRQLLRRAVAADARDVVALTNYGVVSFWLDDYAEARRSLVDARHERKRLLDGTPSVGTNQRDSERYARDTESLDRLAERYLRRIDQQAAAPMRRAALEGELAAELTL